MSSNEGNLFSSVLKTYCFNESIEQLLLFFFLGSETYTCNCGVGEIEKYGNSVTRVWTVELQLPNSNSLL